MLSKPFKPLTIRKPDVTTASDASAVPPAKRRKLSPSEDDRAAVKTEQSSKVSCNNTNNNNNTNNRAGIHRPPLKDLRNPSSLETPSATGLPTSNQTYYSVLWRVTTNKKNKTWSDDGVLAVADGYATLYSNTGRSMGRTAVAAALTPGFNLSIGGKEVEVDSSITKNDYLAVVNPKALSQGADKKPLSNPEPTQPTTIQQPKLSLKEQMKAQILKEKKEKNKAPKQSLEQFPRVAAFKQPLKETTIMPQGPSEMLTPRHNPKAAGAFIFKRPQNPPPGRQTVDVVLDPLLGKQLRPHQQEGVKFLYECVMGLRDFDGKGCILADDMGLGKTLTTIALLWTLLRQNPVHKTPPVVRKALIVCPVSLIRNWKREFKKWLGLDRLGVLEFEDQNTRVVNFDGRVYQVMIIGYERLRSVADDLGQGHPIDIVICDEGHRLKTMKNKSAQAIESLNTKRRIILSGTPIQNDLSEFYAMANFVNDGCLGSQKGFIRDFEKPIMKSRQPDASEDDLERGREASDELARITSPFILRRTADILADFLPPKTEFVLFCKPTQAQAKIYRSVLQSPMFHNALRSNETAFQLITILKKLCNSPALMDPKYGNDDATPSSSLTVLNDMLPSGISKLYQNHLSCKIRLLDQLLQQIRHSTDEKVVVISNYTSTLNLIEQLLKSSDLPSLRLDGSVAASKRQSLVDQFNRTKSSQVFAFLLSAKAGGVGLNLIGASRLILFDVDWNPATDDQAVARIHRQGQKRHCKIYRFLIKGGLEEKIWQRQVVKRALADSIMQGGSTVSSGGLAPKQKAKGQTSTFSQEELKDLFRLDESDGLRTHELIGCECKGTALEEGVDGERVTRKTQVLGEDGEPMEQDAQEVLPEISSSLEHMKSDFQDQPGSISSPAKCEVEAEREELLKYAHLDTSIFSQPDVDSELVERVSAVVDDDCLEHILRLNQDMTGGSSISYVFKKTIGSQTRYSPEGEV
ncbi:helicase [Exophiala xenobiotica]|uniref:Helicase n=1 Tax=Vermiconidia calcicola TaxID=1690605 RepID=A0AAV9Q589_9PEZI|nr:helicase [Exophiala xenobiotica]KAK5534559.1 helicase [Vermiconidia calcicola]KAK5544560.1 helicase [Chaetothyriales sp. CCFEE 6169]KAK5198301.1 helicase [Exophiala xenobiotica]KAK5207493.1 helicase [Exophiala xenobiotica]